MLTPDLLAELDQVLALKRDHPEDEGTARATQRLLQRASTLDRRQQTTARSSFRRALTRLLCDANLPKR